MENKNIVIVGLQPWDIEIGSNCKNIAQEFAKQNRVLYVNRALDRVSRIRQRNDARVKRRIQSLKGEIDDLRKESDNLWVLDPRVILESVNWMPSILFNYFNRINNKRLAVSVQLACERLGFDNIILFIDNEFFRGYHLPEMLHAKTTVFYIRDYLVEQPYFKKHGARMERGLMKKADIVAANSSYLADYARQYNPRSYDIGQGCDFSLFRSVSGYKKPEDLNGMPFPVIGYVGALLGYRLDIDLLVTLAKANLSYNWVLVGPEDEEFKTSELHQLENVHFLGRKDPDDLPGYISRFDVCINPQKVNKSTLGNYPRKVDEYLALGKPVIATYTEFMKSFEGYVYLCRNTEEYLKAINTALNEDENDSIKNKRRDFALNHTWENSVDKLYKALKTPLVTHGKEQEIFR